MVKLIVTALLLSTGLAAAALPQPYSTTGEIRTRTIPLNRLKPNQTYSLEFSTSAPISPDGRLTVAVRQAGQPILEKILHAGDPDVYTPFRTGASGPVELRLDTRTVTGRYRLRIVEWLASPRLKSGANHSWRQADPIALGSTVFASNDEIEYIPLPGTPRAEPVTSPKGEDWYRIAFKEPHAKLVYFQIELMDRDDVPVDVSVFRQKDGKIAEYLDGQDPFSQPHEVQALPGNKFTPRILREKGDYYVRVRANHPEYKLRTREYDPPPYSDPREAVRTAIDYIMGAGDSWFANTPRRGGTFDRVFPVHQETSLCVSCHPSHFSQRAQLYAAAQGYPVVQRQQLAFLQERFYNNPRPFYGFEGDGAVWARVISAPANVLSRMSILTGMFEDQVSLKPRPEYHDRIAKYLGLYYTGLNKLPPDETNGNTPLVSTFEVAWYSWKTTHDARLPQMIAEAPVKNMVDLSYQTLALCEIDRSKYADIVGKNAARILSLQRPDGQWSMRFDPKETEVEFQTGHALWALAAAAVPKENPQVKKAIDYLMNRQQSFGGWMDPLQTYENFKTPFRETQFAILALSTYYPLGERAKGWGGSNAARLKADPVELLDQLDQTWDKPSAAVVADIEGELGSNDALIRQAAAEALGRLALPETAPALAKLLGDPSKLVQRTAAWSLRQVYGNHIDTGRAPLIAALTSPSARDRWGGTRVFAHHFAELARHTDMLDALDKLAADPAPAIRMQAVRALWQAWFWTPDGAARDRIENTILASLAAPQHPWVETNLHAAVYNLADENIRYLYNNWVTLLPRPEDRERAVKGRLAIESRLAGKFSGILTTGSDGRKKRLLASLVDMPLRRGDVYDTTSDLSTPSNVVYNRLGNDIEQIAFFGSAAAQLSAAIRPLLDSPDSELRGLAIKATLLVRETPYAETERVAGGRSEVTREIGKRISATPDAAQVATAFYYRPAPPKPPSTAATAAVVARLDEGYFHAKVEPLFHAKGPDGYACVNCHGTHTLFNATWQTVTNVVDPKDPENSLLLRKPTSTAESEGVVDAKTTAHGGGQRWPRGSPEYDTILMWLKGARQ